MKIVPLLLALCASVASAASPLRVLVSSGDAAGGAALAATIAERGAQAKATASIDGAQLDSTDVLVLDGPQPSAPREALEAFAKRGGGFVVLGEGIAAGDWMQPLVGGAWTANSRKFASLMMLYPLTDAHPITRDTSAFDITDNTAYDLELDASINVLGSAFTPKVLSKRVDNRAPERLDRANVYDIQPQMWTYEGADKHRGFVLLQSGTETLKHASIRTFILRGIAWAGKRENVDELCSKADLATLRYPEGGPRTAADTVKSFDLHPGFKATAIASEPLINKPIAMQWDAKGRLWIAETPEYPNGRRPLTEVAWKETGVLKPDNYDRPATDRISILEDTDGDGVMDKKTVFYQGLELVTGFCLWRDGFIAVHQPDIVFIHGDGPEKKVERLYTGFTPGDTHFVANHFLAAPDGWIYANTGSSADAVSVVNTAVKAKVSSGVFRFKPDGSAIEQVGSKGGNAFGMDVTSDGEVFFGQATSGNPVQHVVLPEWVLTKGKIGKAGSAESVIAGRKVVRPDMPTRVPYMQIDVVGGYSAATASTVQEGGAWPKEWNDTVWCTEPILDIIHFEKLHHDAPNITGEMTEPDREWLRAHDFWFFPVDVEFGPDGAMYVLDFYNPIVAHSDTRGPKHSRAGASVRPDREHYFGRIYRIQSDSATKLEALDLTKADAAGLVKAFTHPNKEVRFNAHRLLLDRADAVDAVPALTTMAAGEKFAPARILALWALERLGKLEPQTLQTALSSDDVSVRKSALLVAEALGEKNQANVVGLLNDSDARVRLLALRAMCAVSIDQAGASALLSALPKLEDDWSRSAALAAASRNPVPMILAALDRTGGATAAADSQSLTSLVSALAEAITTGDDATRLITAIAGKPAADTALPGTVLEGLSRGTQSLPAAVPADALKQLLASPEVVISANALPFAVAWDHAGILKPAIAARIASLLPIISDDKQSQVARSTAIAGLVRSRSADPRIMESVLAVLNSKPADPLLLDIIADIAVTADPKLGKPLVAALPSLSPLGQTALFDALTTRAEWANAVLDAMESKELAPTLLGPAKLSKLRLHPDTAIAQRAVKIFAQVGAGVNAAKDDIIAKLQPEIESKTGDPTKGKALFSTVCATCHKFGGQGNDVGPVLDGIGVHGTHELLVHIIDPSRVVDNEHRTWNIALKNGQFATGIIGRENEKTVTLKLPGGIVQDIRVADIKSRQDTGLSLMPEGLEGLGADGLRDILAYLSGGSSKYRAVNLGSSFTTNTLGGLYASREAKNDTVQPEHYGVVVVSGVPFSLPDPTTTPTGGNVIVLKPGDGGTYASTMPQRVEIPVGYAAGNLHFLSGVAGWGGGPDSHKPAMKVTIEYADGKSQVEELYTGDVFIDYPSGDDVPGSKRAEGIIKRTHIRYFWLPVNERTPIKTVALESYKNGIAPTTLAITADNEPPKPRGKFALGASDEENFVPQFTDPVPKPPATRPANGPRVLLVGGGGSHDFVKFFGGTDKNILAPVCGWVDFTQNLNGIGDILKNVDVLVLSANQPISAATKAALMEYADRGGAIVALHPGTWYNWRNFPQWNQEILGGGARGHDALGPFTVTVTNPGHPVMKEVPATFEITDELYNFETKPGAAEIEVLATATSPKSGKVFPQVFIVKHPKARIVGLTLGHDARAHDLPAYQALLKNAVTWASEK